MSTEETGSSYLTQLPALYQQADGGAELLGRFLRAFEKLFTGLGDRGQPGLEEVLAGIPGKLGGVERYLTPEASAEVPAEARCPFEAPPEFLSWLASWVALIFHADLDEDRQRALIARAVDLYRRRGTKGGLTEALKLYTGLSSIRIEEGRASFRIGKARVGQAPRAEGPGSEQAFGTRLGHGPAHFFRVTYAASSRSDATKGWSLFQVIDAIIQMEKPAHTWYEIRPIHGRFRIGKSRIGYTTYLTK
jgi:phage tail-like protein